MDLKTILERLAAALEHVDRTATTINKSNQGHSYLPGFFSLYEPQQVEALFLAWEKLYPEEPISIELEVNYPTNRRTKCDACLRFKDELLTADNQLYDWALELKYLRSIGDNGKKNDFFVGKAVSPYLHERSSVLDAHRLSEEIHRNQLAKRAAVIMYGFEFGTDVVEYADSICERLGDYGRSDELKKTVDSFGGDLNLDPIIPLFDLAAGQFAKLSPAEVVEFGPLSRHPCALRGKLIGWEIW
ncbi:MAG: hypothetical protein HOI29_11185 [Planctomycetes bacterium]|jgi:hypothetical protein|nr:hypothetical protein [Planctomycetota bacterium]